MIYAAKVPTVVRDYGFDKHPIIVATFANKWVRYPFNKRITISWARKLKTEGISQVTLSDCDRVADFTIDEILRGGN